MRKFPNTIAGFTTFLGVSDVWFINPVVYSDRCRLDYIGQCFEYIYDGIACDGGGFECTKYHKINDLVAHGLHELVTYDMFDNMLIHIFENSW